MSSTQRPVSRGVLIRYRILAYVTAVLLLLLVFYAVPVQIWGHNKRPEQIIGMLHGYLYMLYLVFAFESTVKLKVPLGRMVLVLLAGTVPFGAFFAERWLTRVWEANQHGLSPVPAGHPEG